MKIQADVAVCGGGCAGLAAGVAAARQGARVILLERAGFAGGIITAVGLPYFDGIADATTDELILGGLPLEMLVRLGVCRPGATHLRDVIAGKAALGHGAIAIPDIEKFKVVADAMLMEQKPRLRVLYHSFVCDVVRRGDRIEYIRVANKAGLVDVEAKVFIDATGDADVASMGGEQIDRSDPPMPMTLHFRIGHVRIEPDTREKVREQAVAAHEAGELPFFYGPFFEFLFANDEAYFHAVRVPGDASDPDDLTRAEIQGRRDAMTMFERWKKNVPGFEDAYFISSGPNIGVRETRRLVGRYVLTEEDILEHRVFDDAVAIGTWYLDVHPNTTTAGAFQSDKPVWPGVYGIPMRSLQGAACANLLVAGRCHSATGRAASSTRVTCTAMSMGEAVGVAGAMAAQRGAAPPELPMDEIQDRLPLDALAS